MKIIDRLWHGCEDRSMTKNLPAPDEIEWLLLKYDMNASVPVAQPQFKGYAPASELTNRVNQISRHCKIGKVRWKFTAPRQILVGGVGRAVAIGAVGLDHA